MSATIPKETVSLCAWCDFDKVQTRAVLAQGKRVSHTICPAHAEQQLARARAASSLNCRPVGLKEAA